MLKHSIYENNKITALLVILSLAFTVRAGEVLQSPDGRIKVEVEFRDNKPYWSVRFDENLIIQNGLLGLTLADDDFSGSYVMVGSATASHNSTWNPRWGDLSEVIDHYNELTLKLQETAGRKRIFHIVLRAYNEGIGCRYHIPVQPNLKKFTIRNSLTEFRFRADHVIYQNRNYEYGTKTISTMTRSEGNVTVAVGEGRFVSLTDADRNNFPQIRWDGREDGSFVIDSLLQSTAEDDPPFNTSWEAMIIAETAAKLYENRYLIENLNLPCAIEDPSWIRPGKAVSQIRNARMVNDEMKALLDWASAHGIEYVEIDHSWNGTETKWTPQEIEFFEANKQPFWEDKPEWRSNLDGNPMTEAKGWVPFRPKADSGGNYVDLNIRQLTAYGKSLNPPVGLCVYVRAALLKEFGGDHPIETVFAAYENMGLAGAKPGFVPSGNQYNERMVAYLIATAAKHKLQLCIHDGYYPSGLSRTYPNLVNVEGVAGDEAEHSIPIPIKSLHDVMLPFTRGLMGPMDYTPEIGRKSKTYCHQVAMIGIFPGRVTIRGGTRQWAPGGEGGQELEFVEKLPSLFDELKVFTDLGKYVIFARRKGINWYIVGMAGPDGVNCQLPMDFLSEYTAYRAAVFSDVPGQRTSIRTEKTFNSETVVPVVMEPNGGYLMILEPFFP